MQCLILVWNTTTLHLDTEKKKKKNVRAWTLFLSGRLLYEVRQTKTNAYEPVGGVFVWMSSALLAWFYVWIATEINML